MMILLTLVLSVACVVDKTYGEEGSLYPGEYKQIATVLFDATDTDHNRRLSRAEFLTRFSLYDANSDGEISRYEYTEHKCKSVPELYDLSHYMFDMSDMNGDNKLVKEDINALFDTIDTTGNEIIGRREFMRFFRKELPKYKYASPHEEKYLHGPSACH